MRPFLYTMPAAILCSPPIAAPQSAASSAGSPALTISGDIPKPLSFSLSEFQALPHKTLKVTNPHSQREEVYDGVPLIDLLKLGGVPQGENLRGAAMSTTVYVEGADGYRVAFSLAELDPGIQDSGVILADNLDGHPLDHKLGPLRLVAPHDLRPPRWVRMVRSVRVVSAPK